MKYITKDMPMTREVLASALKEDEPTLEIMHRAAVMLEQDAVELASMRQTDNERLVLVAVLREENEKLRQSSISHETFLQIATDVCREYCQGGAAKCPACPLGKLREAAGCVE